MTTVVREGRREVKEKERERVFLTWEKKVFLGFQCVLVSFSEK